LADILQFINNSAAAYLGHTVYVDHVSLCHTVSFLRV